jgi:hypothetical protein
METGDMTDKRMTLEEMVIAIDAAEPQMDQSIADWYTPDELKEKYDSRALDKELLGAQERARKASSWDSIED